ALCMWLVWPDAQTREQVRAAFERMQWAEFAPYLFGYLGLLVVVHLCRALRWNNLLAPLGVRIPAGPLLAISSVGVLAILALRAAVVVEEKLLEMIRGFDVLKDQKNLGVFLVWSAVYWTANGLGLYVLARGFHTMDPHFDLSIVGAYATMGLVAVGITLPN